MKVFFINLDRRKERMAYMERQLRDLDVDYERISAIDGRRMHKCEKKAAVNAFRWWCVNGYKPRDGEIGCALSHQNAYRIMVERNLPCACVMEDDIGLDKRFGEMLDAVERFIAEGNSPRVFLLAPYLHRAVAEGASVSFRKVRWGASTGGYVVTRSAAERLLAVNVPLQGTADNWGRWSSKGDIELYDANPIVCHQDPYAHVPGNPEFASDTIDPDTRFVKDMPTARQIIHKLGRIVGKSIDKLLP